jgi:hypothetical protein
VCSNDGVIFIVVLEMYTVGTEHVQTSVFLHADIVL